MSWTWAVATCRGTSHIRDGTRCDDAAACAEVAPGVLFAITCDGAGSAAFGRHGAHLAVRTFTQRARRFTVSHGAWPTDDDIWGWLDETRDAIGAVAARREVERRQFASTLIACLAGPKETVVAHIGDGACVMRSDGAWSAASWPESGEYASTTYFVTDGEAPRLRITRHAPADAVSLFTDGIERLVLDFGQQAVHGPFFQRFIKPIEASGARGRDGSLSSALHDYLGSAAVNERTDDDKSLILAVRR